MIDIADFIEFVEKLRIPDGEVSVEFERRSMKKKLGNINVELPDPHWSDLKVVYGKQTKEFVIHDDDFQEAHDYLKAISDKS